MKLLGYVYVSMFRWETISLSLNKPVIRRLTLILHKRSYLEMAARQLCSCKSITYFISASASIISLSARRLKKVPSM